MILLDTCVIIWDALEPERISKKAIKAIHDADQHNSLNLSDISLWEISMLIDKKRIEIDTSTAKFLNLYLQSRNIAVLPITSETAELTATFGNKISNDPADRIIAATSIIYNAQLITADCKLRDCSLLNTVW